MFLFSFEICASEIFALWWWHFWNNLIDEGDAAASPEMVAAIFHHGLVHSS